MSRPWVPFVVVGAVTVAVMVAWPLLTPDPAEQAAAAAKERAVRAEAMGAHGTPDTVSAACRHDVEDRLRSPSTATWADPEVTRAGQVWSVVGAVEAANALGGRVTSDYRCTVSVAASGAHSVTSTVLSP